MFILSAFADEISPDPREQIAVLKACNIRHIEFRSIYVTNVLMLSDAQIQEFKKLLDGEGFGLSAIGSPVGKYPIDQPLEPQLDKLKRAIELCGVFGTPNIRVFSFYPPADKAFDGNWAPYREEVIRRMGVLADMAQKAGVKLFHENEHKIFGDEPTRVADLMRSVNNPALRCAYDAANWVYCGYDPVQGWELTKQYVEHFHIKDWKGTGEQSHTGCLAGFGGGRIEVSIRDAVQSGYHGFATMEPHLRGGGPTGGITGADLFPVAVEAFRKILHACGGQEG
ncbi:MAG: sugar phosphate isomerase/epimerase [Bacteroidales bacterium]|nr:sugar phosphate isomerase/epimerase [Bacteroidales bacterium]